MKVLCEVVLQVNDFRESQFSWLKNHDEDILFLIEHDKRLRMISVKNEPSKEVQSASLSDSRSCTYLSWNKGQSLLAIVVDKKQIYFWEIRKNSFIHFKPQFGPTQSSLSDNDQVNPSINARKSRPRDIELVVWSKKSDKLAICYATGQILLCRFASDSMAVSAQKKTGIITSVWEKFIDNSDSVLKRIVAIEVSEHSDLFACFSVISEILVMTFDGQIKFYSQSEGLRLSSAKFSAPTMEYCKQTRTIREKSTWLAHQSSINGISFRKISLSHDDTDEPTSKLDTILYANQKFNSTKDSNRRHLSKLVCFHWLDANRLIACFSSGVVLLVHLQQQQSQQHPQNEREQTRDEPGLMTEEILRIEPTCSLDTENQSMGISDDEPPLDQFKWFELGQLSHMTTNNSRIGSSPSFALAAGTNHRLFYYELYEIEKHKFYAERVDDLDLSESLQKLQFNLERARWSHDCSMLAVQLTSGHILVYRTRLTNYMVASHGPQTAYLSGPNEITILNYGHQHVFALSPSNDTKSSSGDIDQVSHNSSSPLGGQSENASILNVSLKPSLLAIGPKHLAFALNNRVRFYSLELIKRCYKQQYNKGTDRISSPVTSNSSIDDTSSTPKMFTEQEYVTVIVALSLSSRFVGAMFVDGRLKLHSIGRMPTSNCGESSFNSGRSSNSSSDADDDADERFFPDPSKPEEIASFILTEELLIYCTKSSKLNVFSLTSWTLIQSYDHSSNFHSPVISLKPNDSGNKFICLLDCQSGHNSRPRNRLGLSGNVDNVYLYDLYSNTMLTITDCDLFEQLCRQSIDETLTLLPYSMKRMQQVVRGELDGMNSTADQQRNLKRKFSQIIDAVWDTDGRSVLLIERRAVHVVAILNHTLEREEPIGVLAASSEKPAGYTILYASQGIVSFQTSLGRVINSVLKTHDDEFKLIQLEERVQLIKNQALASSVSSGFDESGQRTRSNSVDSSKDTQRPYKLPKDVEAHLRIICLKLQYLRTILPIYPLPKCREICEHLMSDEQFGLEEQTNGSINQIVQGGDENSTNSKRHESSIKLIKRLIWYQLAAWSLFTLNLDYAFFIYRKYNLQTHAYLLNEIIEDLRHHGLDSNATIKERLLFLLGHE